MASTITHTQVRTLISGSYQTVDTATASVNIPLEPFVFAVSDDTYNRVATTFDMQTYPNSRAAAVAAVPPLAFYRLAAVTKAFPVLSDAEEFATGLKDRLKALVVEYAEAITHFVGSDTTTVSS